MEFIESILEWFSCFISLDTFRNPSVAGVANQGTPRRTAMTTNTKPKSAKAKEPSKKAQMINMLKRPHGASIKEFMDTIGWQQHSVRGALVHLKNRDKLPITSTVTEGVRRYQLAN